MIDLLAGRPGQLLAETLLHFLWQGAALALLLTLIDPLLRSVEHRYVASLGTLLVMLAMPLTTGYMLIQRDQLQPVSAPDVATMDASAVEYVALDSDEPLKRLQPLLVAVWLLGVLLLAARLLVGYAATLWLRGARQPLPAELAEKVAWLGRRLGVATRCRVFLSARTNEAIAVGCFKPLVLVPLAWANELPASVLEAVIAHELAHIRRWDLWATLLQRLAETLLFYHPAVWWLSRRLSQERELCCDALAVSATRRPAEYVLALEILARRTSTPPLSLATSFLGGGNMNLLDRVRHVLMGGSRESSASWLAGLAALAAPLLAGLALAGWSLLPATLVADEEKKERADSFQNDDEERSALETKIRFLADDNDDEDMDDEDERMDEDEEEDDEAEEKARRRERKQREVKDARELDERALRKKERRESGDDLDLSEFQPQTDREERLLAVIKKLQAQIKETNWSKKRKGPELEAKREYMDLVEKLNREKAVVRKRTPEDKEAAVHKEREAREQARAREEKERDTIRVEVLNRKDRQIQKQHEARERKEREAAEKEGYLEKLQDAESFREGKFDSDDMEGFRRTLKEREAQLEKAAAALKRQARQLAEERERVRQHTPRKEDAERKERETKERERKDGDREYDERKKGEEREASKEHAANVIDELIRARLEQVDLIEPDDAPRKRLWLDLFGVLPQ